MIRNLGKRRIENPLIFSHACQTQTFQLLTTGEPSLLKKRIFFFSFLKSEFRVGTHLLKKSLLYMRSNPLQKMYLLQLSIDIT
jgi:hypothetical protein